MRERSISFFIQPHLDHSSLQTWPAAHY